VTSSPQTEAAGQQAGVSANLASQLSMIALPELTRMIGGPQSMIGSQLASTAGGNVKSSMDQANYNTSLSQLNQGYGQAAFGDKEAINYNALRSGEGRLSSAVPESSIASSATRLEDQRQQALSNLNFQSASSSLTDYNQLLGLMGMGAKSALGLSGQAGGLANQAISGLSNQTDMSTMLGIVGGVGSVLGAV